MIGFVIAVLVTFILVQLTRLVFADCDLHLQWYSLFGKKPGNWQVHSLNICEHVHSMEFFKSVMSMIEDK